VEGPDAATKAIVLALVLVLVAIFVLVAAAIFLGAAGLLDFPEGKAVPSCVDRGLTLSAVVDTRGIEQAVRVESFSWRAIFS
jgi:hypothetical protein